MGIETIIVVLGLITVLVVVGLVRSRGSGGKDHPNPGAKS
jgi:hypothetical protein